MQRRYFILFYYLFSLVLSQIYENRTVGFRRAEGKVDLRDESYAWTPKSWSFDKLREVWVLSYLSYTLFKCFVDD